MELQLRASCDGLTLLVCCAGGTGLFYDVRSLGADWTPSRRVRFSTAADAADVVDAAWNPTGADTVAVCLSDGSLVVAKIGSTQKWTFHETRTKVDARSISVEFWARKTGTWNSFVDC